MIDGMSSGLPNDKNNSWLYFRYFGFPPILLRIVYGRRRWLLVVLYFIVRPNRQSTNLYYFSVPIWFTRAVISFWNNNNNFCGNSSLLSKRDFSYNNSVPKLYILVYPVTWGGKKLPHYPAGRPYCQGKQDFRYFLYSVRNIIAIQISTAAAIIISLTTFPLQRHILLSALRP